MKCEPTQTPPADAIDIPALRERYRRERDQRIRREGQDQYVKTQDDFTSSYEADPHMPVQARAPIHEDLAVAILGAGFSGIMAGDHMRNAGVSTSCTIAYASAFGGVWYWHRHRGIQCSANAK